ncbi:LysR family transcriptional regulator [Acinetobacter stercoris]|uniref:HTH-type transcriptional regulator DmlR n=1 Tax=Acinetobacter stercoris TaxID=2126983 RepID=A0A2U3N2H5_9GAMM|nr:LysR family transcriptional regulator [Acinetobacter stercoris]SPL71871.1 HTH-type transcriptional regulator DmlR [Acinetobacter stercoris]
MTDQLNGIYAFVYVAESENFTIAAQKLNLSRSAVAKIITRLEQRLNTQLFHRTTRKMNLTREGQLFYEHCKSALNEIESATQYFEQHTLKPIGKVRISVPHLLGQQCVMPIITQYVKDNPELEIQVSFSDQVVDLYTQGYDIAIRTGQLEDTFDLKSRKIGVQKMKLCCSPDFLNQANINHIDDLKNYNLLAYSRGDWILPWKLYQNGQLVQYLPHGRIQLDDLPALIYAAKQGLGIAWLPTWLVKKELKAGQLVTICPETQGYGIDVNIVWRTTKYLPCRIRFILDLLVHELSIAMQ